MKVGLAVIARMGSSRLPGKHLLPALEDGSPFCEVLVERLKTLNLPIILATGADPKDNELTQFFDGKLSIFRGHDTHIPLRILNASMEQDWDAVIPIDGDDVLVSIVAINHVKESLIAGAKYVTTAGLPFGMNVSGFHISFLKKSAKRKSEAKFETGWGRIFNEAPALINYPITPIDTQLRFSLDYPEDLKFFRKLFTVLPRPFTAEVSQIREVVIKHGLHEINQNVIETYWQNFELEREKEILSWKKP